METAVNCNSIIRYPCMSECKDYQKRLKWKAELGWNYLISFEKKCLDVLTDEIGKYKKYGVVNAAEVFEENNNDWTRRKYLWNISVLLQTKVITR